MTAVAVAFVILMVIGTPIAFALGLAGVIGIHTIGFDLTNAARRMFTSIDSFVLLAAPFYILAGEIMNRGGITDRLIRLSSWLVGRIRGGTAYANVLASILFSGISGTAIADTAALGKIFIRGMPNEGYSKEFAAAVTVASSMIGPIIPPSVIMIIYAAVSRVSVIQLFLAGILPGILLALACALVIFLTGRFSELPKSAVHVPAREMPRLIGGGVVVISLPLFVVLGTLSGAFTATEAGGIAVVYAAVLGFLVFRGMSLHTFWRSVVSSARMTSSLFIVISCVAVASYVLTITGGANFAQQLGVIFEGQPVLFMIVVALMLLVVGAVLDPGIQVLLIAPLLLPSARAMGIDDLQFSMVILLAGNLSLITPPVGIVLFVACRIGDIRVGRMFRAVLPFFVAEAAIILLIILVPEIATLVPDAVSGR